MTARGARELRESTQAPIGGEAHLPFGVPEASALAPEEMGAATEVYTQTRDRLPRLVVVASKRS